MVDLPLDVAERQTLTIAGKRGVLAIGQGAPVEAQRLIWDEFFASRNRGIDWHTHLPWVQRGEALCASASIDERIVAALLVRRIPNANAAMIGCVCVDPTFRGHGLSRQLIDFIATPLRTLGIEQMLLWTGKPAVYESAGFAIVAEERCLALTGHAARGAPPVALTSWPDGDTLTGLPPFATAGWRANVPRTQILFVDTPTGAALLDQTGAPADVLRLMFVSRPGNWSATLGVDHPLRSYAIAQGACLDDAPGPATMARPLGDNVALPACVPPAFRI